MKIGRTALLVEPGGMPEYIMQVYKHTSELFFLLEAAECIKTRVECGKKKALNGFGPTVLSITLKCIVPNIWATTEAELGHAGRLTQLAYIGWVAAVDGAWEQYRTKPPFDKNENNLKHGMQADLFGDFHKIRNDLLKHRGIAQPKNTGKCTVLKWFRPGDHMQMSLEHVLDFLNQLGGYMRSYASQSLIINWHLRDHLSPKIATPYRVISNRVAICGISPERGSDFGLFYSIMFADGITSTVLVRRASTADDLVDEMNILRGSPRDEYGAIMHPGIGRLDVRQTYRTARQTILDGEVPADPGTPWILFR